MAVLDCQLPVLEGTEVAQEIRRRGLPVRVLELSAYDDERYVRGMLEAGAVGYLLKDEAPETIVAAVRAVARGERYFSPPVASKVAAWARGERPGELTERELEVLRLVAKGLSNKEIAQTLSITVRTVDFHVSNILKLLLRVGSCTPLSELLQGDNRSTSHLVLLHMWVDPKPSLFNPTTCER